MNNMFFETSLTTLDVSHFDMGKTTHSEGMLESGALKTLYLSSTMDNLAEDALSDVGQCYFVELVIPQDLTINADTI